MKDKLTEYLKQTKNPYQIKVGDMNITFEYSENSKTIKDCMMNILNQKNRIG